MCFSATASLSAGTLLLGIGTLTLKSARHPRELPFAAIPILVAIQQLTEGVIWLTFRVSVWCFFAALLSAIVYLHFVSRRTGRGKTLYRYGATLFDRSTENTLRDNHP